MMDARIAEELGLLRERWANLDYREQGRWVLLPGYSLPDTCVQDESDVAFQIKAGHPGDGPYAFYVKRPIDLQGDGSFQKTTDASDPPFSGEWLKFSWRPENWRPAGNPREGSNLYDWAVSFWNRLSEGP